MANYYKDSKIEIGDKAAYKNRNNSGSWIILNGDGTEFAKAHYGKDENWWQVYQGMDVGAGRTLHEAVKDIHWM